MRFINTIFKDLLKRKHILIYIDDILIATETIEEHFNILKEVFEILTKNHLQLQLAKCSFMKTKIEYLGYKISENGIQPSEKHVECITNFPIPRNVHEVHRFIGLASYFRKFIANFSIITRPLYDLVKITEKEFIFGEIELNSFETLRSRLISEPVLKVYSPFAKTELHTDASSVGFGGVLMQAQPDGVFHPVMYFSKRTNKFESKLHSFELETLAVVYSIERFHIYLQGIEFTIVTDCIALKETLAKKDINPKIARWELFLSEYHYVPVHRKSEQMKHVDALSRAPNIYSIENENDNFTRALIASQLYSR